MREPGREGRTQEILRTVVTRPQPCRGFMEMVGPCQRAADGQVSSWYQWKRKLMELGRRDKNDTGTLELKTVVGPAFSSS